MFIRQDPETGDIILSRKPPDWASFFAALNNADIPADFLDENERKQAVQNRDPFVGWYE